jgi:hypothetical protein
MKIFLELLLEVGIIYTITQVISESKLTLPFRDWLETVLLKDWHKLTILKYPVLFFYTLISCFLCTSIWVSWGIGAIFFNLITYLGYNNFPIFWNGLFLAFLVWFLRKLEDKLSN